MLLEDSGALEQLRGGDSADPARSARYAAWLVKLIDDFSHDLRQPMPKLYEEIERAASGMASLPTVRLAAWAVHPALLDALLTAGLSIGLDSEDGHWQATPSVRHWYKDPYGDLAHLAADPVLGPTVLGETTGMSMLGEHLDLLLEHSGTRVMLAGLLENLAATRERLTGALPTLGSATTEVLEQLADPRVRELAPDAVDRLFSFEPAEELAAAVNAGLVTELTWPVYEDAYRRVCVHAADWAEKHPASRSRGRADGVTVCASYPHVALIGGEHIEVVGPEGVFYSGTGPFGGAEVTAVYTVGDTGVVIYRDQNTWTTYLWWFGEPAAVEGERVGYWHPPVTVPIGDADHPGRLLGGSVLRPGGDLPDADRSGILDLPGDVIYSVSGWGQEVCRFDRATGESLGSAVYADDSEIHAALGLDAPGGFLEQVGFDPGDPDQRHTMWGGSLIVGLPEEIGDSPTGSVAGRQVTIGVSGRQFGSASIVLTPVGIVRAGDVLGAFRGDDTAGPLMRLPGGVTQVLVAEQVLSPTTGAYLSSATSVSGARHCLHQLTAPLWCMTTPRDPQASERMRGYTTGDAAAVLEALADRDLTDRALPTVASSYSYRSDDGASHTTAVLDPDFVRGSSLNSSVPPMTRSSTRWSTWPLMWLCSTMSGPGCVASSPRRRRTVMPATTSAPGSPMPVPMPSTMPLTGRTPTTCG